MAKKRELTEAQRARLISQLLDDLEHGGHFPSEYIQALREELAVHPEKSGLDKESFEEKLDVLFSLLTEAGQRQYGNEGENIAEPTGIEEEIPQFLPSDNIQKYTIRISLKDVSPTVWRKLEVPSNITLTYLAEILIYAMGWEGYHLNQFRKGQDIYKALDDYDKDFAFGFSRFQYHESEKFTLGQVLVQKGDKMILEYDFGDGWAHQVSLSNIEPYAEGETPTLHLLSGKNACPPEDCGGPWGYAALCEYYYTRKKDKCFPKEHYALVDKYFNPEYFPLAEYQAGIEEANRDI